MTAKQDDATKADLGYGPRLSDDDYQRRIVRLQEGLPPVPSREQDREVRRAELDLAIDHRLGREFPEHKRRRLWRIMEDVEKRRLRLIGKYLVTRLFSRKPGPVRAANALAQTMVDQFAKVLDERELESFFGPEGSTPVLPVDQPMDDALDS